MEDLSSAKLGLDDASSAKYDHLTVMNHHKVSHVKRPKDPLLNHGLDKRNSDGNDLDNSSSAKIGLDDASFAKYDHPTAVKHCKVLHVEWPKDPLVNHGPDKCDSDANDLDDSSSSAKHSHDDTHSAKYDCLTPLQHCIGNSDGNDLDDSLSAKQGYDDTSSATAMH